MVTHRHNSVVASCRAVEGLSSVAVERFWNARDQMKSREPTVLLIDDDEDCRIIYSAALEQAGFRVLLADNGADGVQTAKTESPDVVLLDVTMPIMDGRTAVRALKADPATRDLPVVAITAAASLHNSGDLAEAGFDAVLLKPVSPQIVVAAVRQSLPHSRS